MRWRGCLWPMALRQCLCWDGLPCRHTSVVLQTGSVGMEWCRALIGFVRCLRYSSRSTLFRSAIGAAVGHRGPWRALIPLIALRPLLHLLLASSRYSSVLPHSRFFSLTNHSSEHLRCGIYSSSSPSSASRAFMRMYSTRTAMPASVRVSSVHTVNK